MSSRITSNAEFNSHQQNLINEQLGEFMTADALGVDNKDFMWRLGCLINQFLMDEKVYHPIKEYKSAEEKKKIASVKEEFVNTLDNESAEGWARVGEGGLDSRGTCFVADKMMETPLNPYPYYLDWDTAVAKAEEIKAGGITKTIKGYSLRVHRYGTRQKCDSQARRNDGMASWVREYKFSETKSFKIGMKDLTIKPYHLFKNLACHRPRAVANKCNNDLYVEDWSKQYVEWLSGDKKTEFEYEFKSEEWSKPKTKSTKSKKSKKEKEFVGQVVESVADVEERVAVARAEEAEKMKSNKCEKCGEHKGSGRREHMCEIENEIEIKPEPPKQIKKKMKLNKKKVIKTEPVE